MALVDWLNYHHLLYFWTVAREGSVTGAAKRLHLTQPTISGQLRSLEDALGEKLFERQGRGLKLTEAGSVVFRYADEIFNLGKELQDTLRGRPTGRPLRLHVGVSDSLPKLVTYRLLSPALQMDTPVRMICEEHRTEHLLANLSVDGLDLVLADEPLSSGANVRAYNHFLGESAIALFATPALCKKYKKGFPGSLEAAPLLLPMQSTAVRRGLDRWFEQLDVRPRVIGEFSDSALLKVFGEHGMALFPAPSVVARDVCKTYGVQVAGTIAEVTERFFAISVERRIKHPAVAAITEAARSTLFGAGR